MPRVAIVLSGLLALSISACSDAMEVAKMDEARLWSIVEKWALQERVRTGVTPDSITEFHEWLKRELSMMSQRDIHQFTMQYYIMWARLDRKDLRAVASLVLGSESDEPWSETRFYVIALGRAVYEDVQRDARLLADGICKPEDASGALMRSALGGCIAGAMTRRTHLSKEEFTYALSKRPTPNGDMLQEGEAVVLFPELARRYGWTR